MNGWDGQLKKEEQTIFRLRALFEQYGYRRFKMSKFEEYDFYAENRSFLTTKNIITFQGLQGQLLALKPDVTLSIIKHTKANMTCPDRVYYHENVYRARKDDDEYKEIMQVGLEYIGEVDDYAISEVVLLAKKSLDSISTYSILNVSHMGFLLGLLEETGLGEAIQKKLLACISEKNPHGIAEICAEYGIAQDLTTCIQKVAALHGTLEDMLPIIWDLCRNDTMRKSASELEQLEQNLCACIYQQGVHLDFSIVNDMDYYNGIMFQGFVDGIPTSVLSGGRYDNLVHKCGKQADAVGFAVYVDMLEGYGEQEQTYDVDTLLLCDDTADTIAKLRAVQMLQNMGLRVAVQKQDDGRLRYKQLCRLGESGVEFIG